MHSKLIFGPIAFSKYFKFTFVRSPFDRVVSAYNYLKSGGLDKWESPWIQKNILPFSTFAEFAKNRLNHPDIMSDLHFRPQHHFICDKKMRVMVDYIGRYENLGKDFQYIADTLGVDAKLQKINVSKRERDPRFYYSDDDCINAVATVYAEDLKIFGYEFD